jgi:putative polyketide hydroxylase
MDRIIIETRDGDCPSYVFRPLVGAPWQEGTDFADHTALSGEPGTRAPHVPITEAGHNRSTLDLFDRDFVLLSVSNDWHRVAGDQAKGGFALRPVQFGIDITAAGNADLAAGLGLGEGGALLIRPDGFVAWRATERSPDPADELTAALEQLGLQGGLRPGT